MIISCGAYGLESPFLYQIGREFGSEGQSEIWITIPKMIFCVLSRSEAASRYRRAICIGRFSCK